MSLLYIITGFNGAGKSTKYIGKVIPIYNHECAHFISLISFTFQGHSQVSPMPDSLAVKCDDKIFISCEEPPFLKNGAESYQTLLTNFLSEKKQLPTKGTGLFSLMISKTGEVPDVQVRKNSIKEAEALIFALKSLSDEWDPGKQNKHIICAYRTVEIKVRKKLMVNYLRKN